MIYLDHNATTPIDPEILSVLTPFLKNSFGNPNSIHWAGRDSRVQLENARENIAGFIGATPSEIVITSCGTESDNHAIIGVFETLKDKGNHIISTKVEHPAILETLSYLQNQRKATVTYLNVDDEGHLNLEELKNAITNKTILITVMTANNETGVIFPIPEISKIAKEKGILLHTDAVQALGKIPVNVKDFGVDLLSFSGHKVYAPKGVGGLYIRSGLKLNSFIHGGHQEKGRRGGTENTPGIIALGKACEIAKRDFNKNSKHILSLRDRLEAKIPKLIDDIKINGQKAPRVPNTSNMSFKYIEGESILLNLDLFGIATSSGSACTSGSLEPSHVLLAMGLSHETAHGSIRFSLGKDNTIKEIDKLIEVLPGIVSKLREMSPIYECKS